jgi:signal peptidase I
LAFAKPALILVAVLLVAAVVFVVVFVRPYRMPSSSMEPTFHCARPGIGCGAETEDRFVVLRLGGWGRGDVVAFHTPPAATERCGVSGTYVKRVIGLPGETVREAGGVISVNGKRLREPYVAHRDSEFAQTWHVPRGSYFVLGDNRAESCDSRVWGAVPKANVVGRVFLVYWPPGRWGFR